jgi:dihydroxyacetone kinase-like predicted kinase
VAAATPERFVAAVTSEPFATAATPGSVADAATDAPSAAATAGALRGVAPGASSAGGQPAGSGAGHAHEGEFGYEVQYLLDATEDAVGRLRPALDAMGDSLVVVGTGDGDPPTWNVHVHVRAEGIGPAVEAGIAAGRPYRITVTPLDDRAAERTAREGPRGAVVVAVGEGLTALFEAEGAIVVGRNPSTAEMLAAITAADAQSVVLLPNDANTHAVATTAAREAGRAGLRVSVVPTRSPVQALAALAVRDHNRAFADDVIAMAEAAGACRYGEVCTAQRAAFTVAGPCQAGDLLGLVDGEVHVIGADLEDVSRRLLDRMLGGGGELATLVLGADAPDGLDELLRGHVTQSWPFVELQSYAGGQPRYHLLVGVE